MLEGHARRALEEEAIALVNLSNSHLTKKRAPTDMMAATTPQRYEPRERGSLSDILPLLQQKKAALMARRDDCSAPHPHRVKQSLREDRDHAHCVSMSVFVSADGKMSMVPGGKSSPNNYVDFEMRTPKQFNDDGAVVRLKHEYAESNSPTNAATADSHISMQSLLVTLKKRKAKVPESMSVPAIKLPRFRDIFETPRYHEAFPPINSSIKTEIKSPEFPAPLPTPPSPQPEESPLYPPPPELKCKYRTGKCTNIRALKSCGDYHNLCNYHRLRANANQRKLDRKKKVQRQHPSDSDNTDGTSPVKAPTLMPAPTAAAAAALASLPTSYVGSHEAPRPPSNGAPAMFLPYLMPPMASIASGPSSSASYPGSAMLHPKSEGHTC